LREKRPREKRPEVKKVASQYEKLNVESENLLRDDVETVLFVELFFSIEF
jgi:hypothetical protein